MDEAGDWESVIGLDLEHRIFGKCKILGIDKKDNHIDMIVFSSKEEREIRLVTPFFNKPDIYIDINFPEDKLEQVRHKLYIRRVIEKWTEFKGILQNTISSFVKKDRGLVSLSPQLDEKDKRLTWIWHDHFRKRNVEYYLYNPIPDYNINDREWTRLFSARLAEKAALVQFIRQEASAEDLSIQQLDPDNNEIWRKADIRFKGQLFDVKNARKSFWNEQNYVEHSVPRFKNDPIRVEKNVQILGTLSEDLNIVDYLCANSQKSTNVRILGVTDTSRLMALSKWFSIPGQLTFSFQRDKGNGVITYLPPWVYRMPEALYTKIDQNIDYLYEFVTCNVEQVAEDAARLASALVGPLFISPTAVSLPENILKSLPEWAFAWLEDLRLAVSEQGCRHELAFIFASILKHFILMANKPMDQTVGYTPAEYRKILYHSDDMAHRYPLLAFDPLTTINSMVDALDTIWRVKRDALHGYQFFRLQNALILRGYKDNNDHGTTLIAYCGGEKRDRTSCHYYPLVIGKQGIGEPCTCGHLICPECGYCSQGCAELEKRVSDKRK